MCAQVFRPNSLIRLQQWYFAQCNGQWEHEYGVTIDTLDNPGWHLQVEYRDTYLQGRILPDTGAAQSSVDEHDWMTCNADGEVFNGYGGPEKLGDLIDAFLVFAQDS